MSFNVPYRPRTPAKDFEETLSRYPHWPLILAEGDSWFAHPKQWNILYQLQDLAGYAIRRLASIGVSLADMIRESDNRTPQYVRQLDRMRFRWRYLLFSGGGNDLLGANLDYLLRDRRDVSRWEDVRWCSANPSGHSTRPRATSNISTSAECYPAFSSGKTRSIPGALASGGSPKNSSSAWTCSRRRTEYTHWLARSSR